MNSFTQISISYHCDRALQRWQHELGQAIQDVKNELRLRSVPVENVRSKMHPVIEVVCHVFIHWKIPLLPSKFLFRQIVGYQ